jgi:hypothetical protein
MLRFIWGSFNDTLINSSNVAAIFIIDIIYRRDFVSNYLFVFLGHG